MAQGLPHRRQETLNLVLFEESALVAPNVKHRIRMLHILSLNESNFQMLEVAIAVGEFPKGIETLHNKLYN